MSSTTAAASAAKTGERRNGRRSEWYKDAVIYQLHVRSFFDTNGDGIGDFRGLTSKLDYIQELGVTAIWLLPFYPSPLRDEGYDIAEYTNVNPAYGTLEDFRRFLDAAHRRNLQVITELVINHTSDQHAWFQRARRAAPGTPERDFYVWSDDPERYRDARIIFQDFEPSNWTLDPVAKSYFWHRFYSHQPDLNYENSAVHEAIFRVVDFWMELGVDGMRLDAVPYLYEREGTNCENLPETHHFLKKLRSHIDGRYDNRLLLAEANQWPEDAAAYFGAGDECHMNFNFPLMTRLFIAMHHEDSFPIVDIIRQTPAIPDNCQWGIFLRNHDELTLEMVTDEERDRMYKAYASDPRARVNLGIRRRLAPLLKSNRRKIELMNGLLMSLPGSPIIYYGDEIEMGDNIYLSDRDAVRTPMQWSPDRNAGFSTANPQRLFLPPIIDPEFHYSMRNVENQVNSPHSLLWWTRRLVRLRQRYRAFARGSIEFLPVENPKMLAFLREFEGETILVVANLSRFAQCVELDLSRYRGRAPLELFGKTRFPLIGELPYFLTLGPNAFLWFRLEWPSGELSRISPDELPLLEVEGDWCNTLEAADGRAALSWALADYLARNRWFGGPPRTLHDGEIVDWVTFVSRDEAATPFHLLQFRVTFTEGEPEVFLLPVFCVAGRRAEGLLADRPTAGICRVRLDGGDGVQYLCDATAEREMYHALFALIDEQGTLECRSGRLIGRALDPELVEGNATGQLDPIVQRRPHHNSSAQIGERYHLKIFRHAVEGPNPELELGQAFARATSTPDAPSAPVAPLAGWLAYEQPGQPETTLAVLHAYEHHQSSAWRQALDQVSRFCEGVTVEFGDLDPLSIELPATHVWDLAAHPPTELAHETIGDYLRSCELLGQRTAELHRALAHAAGTALAPEPLSKLHQRSMYQTLRTATVRGLDQLRTHLVHLPEAARELAVRVVATEEKLLARCRWLVDSTLHGQRIRCHGDYHLGQVLFTGKDYRVIDFEGQPERPASERRIKRSPLRDVASMLRSLHYASSADVLGLIADLAGGQGHLGPTPRLRRWLNFWYLWTGAAFVRGYATHLGDAKLLSPDPVETRRLLDIFLIERLVHEVGGELNNRPDWVRVPLAGLLELAESAS